MSDQKLTYAIDGDASGLKKALAESEAAHRKLTDALTRKGVEIAALRSAEYGLKKIEAAAAEAKRQMDFFRHSAEVAPGGIKLFSKDIDRASKQLEKLTQQALAQRALVAGRRGALGEASTGVVAAEEATSSAASQKRIALIEAERQARVAHGNQVLASLRSQAAENERVAAVERRRTADEAAGARAAQANARVRAAAMQSAAREAQNAIRAERAAQLQAGRGEMAVVKTRMLAAAQATAAAKSWSLTAATQRQNSVMAASNVAVAGARMQLAGYAATLLSVGAAVKGVEAITSAGTKLQALNSTLLFATGSAEAAASGYAFVRAEAERLGLPLEVLGKQFAQISAASFGTALQGEKTREIFSAVASAARVMGLQTFQVERALLAVQQMMSKGTVQAEELRGQLGEQIPGAFQIAARAMNVTTAELGDMLKAGEVLSEDFLPKFAAELQRTVDPSVPAAVKTYAAEIERLKNTFTIFLQEVGKSGALEAISSQVVIVTQKLQEMSDSGEMKPAINQIVGALSLLAEGLAEVAEFAAKNANTILALAGAFAVFKAAQIGLGLAKLVGEFSGLDAAAFAATTSTKKLGFALKGFTAFAIIGFTVDRLLELVRVMREAARFDEELATARGKRNAEADILIIQNADYAAAVTKTADQVKAASDKEKAAYAQSLKAAAAYWDAVAQREQRNLDPSAPLTQAALDAAKQAAGYRRALREFDAISSERLSLEAKQAAAIKRIKEGETETIRLAMEAQVDAVKKSRNALLESEKALADIAKRTAEFQDTLAKSGKAKGGKDFLGVVDDVIKVRQALAGGDADGALNLINEARAGMLDLVKSGEAEIFLRSYARELGVMALQAGEMQRAAAEANVQDQEGKLLTLQSLAKQIESINITANVDAAEKTMQDLRERTQAFYDANPLVLKVVTQRQDDIALGVESVPKKAAGGLLRGPGSGTSDSILARVSNGEFVVRADAVRRLGLARLHEINRGRIPAFAQGGLIRNAAAAVSASTGAALRAPVVDYGARIAQDLAATLMRGPAFADGGAVESGHANVLNLTLPGVGTFETHVSDSVAGQIQRALMVESLKHGRRK